MSNKASSAQPSSGFSSGAVSSLSSGGTLSFGGVDPAGVQTFWDNIFDEDEDENTEQDPREWDWRDCIIFLIDCQPPMFEQNENGEIPFQNAVKCVISTLTDKIISSENDVIGVCFYGTEKKKNLNDFENIYVFFELDSPDAMKILDLEALTEGEFNLGSATNEFPFSDALWTCSTMFSNCPIKIAHKRIFLFTNEDNPNSTNNNLREQSFQRAKDLAELGIDIELFSMNKVSERFNFKLFYQNIISIAEDEDTGKYNTDAAAKFEELKARVRRKEYKKRNSGKLNFYIGKDIAFSVKVFTLVHETKKGGYSWLDSKNNQPMKMTSQYVCVDTGTLLMDSQIKRYYLYGGERVIFDKDELNSIKAMDSAGFKLMGFKPRSSLKFHHNMTHSSFIYPDEDSVKGSTTLFAALYDRMLASDKMAIARMTSRVNTAPRFCALLPQQEVLDEDGSQLIPPGFHVIQLPFADDLRSLKLNPPIEVDPDVKKEQVTKAKKLVKTLRIKFDSRNFENPALQKHYADLQAVALERTNREETVDYVQPDVEGMMRFSEIVEDFKNSVYPEGYDFIDKTPKKADGKGLKRKMGALADLDWVDLCESGAVNKLTVPQLKEFLKCQGIKTPSKAKKDNFVQIVVDHVTSGKLKKELLPAATADDMEEQRGEDEDENDGRAKKKLKVDKDEDEEREAEERYITGKGKAADKSTNKNQNKNKDDNSKNKNETTTTNKNKSVDKPKPTNNNNNNNNKNNNINKNNNNNKNNASQQSSVSSASVASFTNDDDDDDDNYKTNKSQSQSQSQNLSQSQNKSQSQSVQSQSQSKLSNVSSVSQSFDNNKSFNSASSGSLSFNNYTKNNKKRTIDDNDDSDDDDPKSGNKSTNKKPDLQRSESDVSSVDNDTRPKCHFWERCYRTNPDHLKQFRHPPQTKGSFSQ